MRREASIPLFLWVASAALAHLIWGGGAEQGARLIDERLDVGRFAAGIRSHVRGSIAPPIEIAISDEAAPDEPAPEDKPAEDPPQDDEALKTDEQAPDEVKKEPEKAPKVEPTKPEPEEKKEPEQKDKPEPPKTEPAKPAEPVAPAPPVPQLVLPNKIAVKQHVEDEHQKDNPDAALMADKANRVAQETQARVTSTDQDSPRPSPGSAPSGPREAPGNAEETHVRQDSDQEGNKELSPGGSATEQALRAAAAHPAPQTGAASAAAPGQPATSRSDPSHPTSAASQDKDQVAKAATPENPGAPEVVASEGGSFAMKAPEAATKQQRAQKAKKRLPPRKPRSLLEQLGLGSAGRTQNGVALNLTPNMAAEAIGSDELSRLRRADGERRRSQHRGSWRTPSFEHYRSAIENYVPTVKPGNQTALNTAAVPFASYLNQIHSRIHPIFADQFLASLDSLPASHPMNDATLVTAIEIVVEREEGRLVRRGMTRTSGVTAFDIQAIAAVERAAPFGAPPSEIVSPDGNVYLHWEFRRDGMMCSTLFAHPYILNVQPKPAPVPTAPPQPPFRGPEDDAPQNGERHGLLAPPPARDPAAPPG